jgi:hypothetical protein
MGADSMAVGADDLAFRYLVHQDFPGVVVRLVHHDRDVRHLYVNYMVKVHGNWMKAATAVNTAGIHLESLHVLEPSPFLLATPLSVASNNLSTLST